MAKAGWKLAVVLIGLAATQNERASFAQLPKPRLTSLSRLGVKAGESVDVTLRGTDLEGVDNLWFDHPGLRAFHLKGTTFRVAAAMDVPLGQHDVRAVGLYGVSNPRTFVVGNLAEGAEVEPNNNPEQATPISAGTVVNGEVAPTDVDCFAFQAKAGQRLRINLAAEKLESRLDATIRVLGPDGREVAESRDSHDSDPFLDLAIPSDGRYVLKVHDVVYNGSADHPYRLTVSDGPHIDAITPAIATPGVSTQFTLLGRNIGGVPAPELVVDGVPLERKSITLTPPAGDLDATNPSLELLASGASSRRGFEFATTLPSGHSNAVFVGEAVDPVVVEHEPNDEDSRAQSLTLPCDISGTFEAPNDTDIYRFTAKKGQVWWIEASAERLGSPADPVFVIQKVIDKGVPQDLATGEDSPDQGAGTRFLMSSVDASLQWQVPEDGTYQVVISDLYSSQRGDPRLVYRLNIRPARPDFRLYVVPEGAAGGDSLTIGAGGRASAYVIAWRIDGFTGPIRVEAQSLPAGVHCDPVTIAANQVMAPVVFEADEKCPPSVGLARLVGHSRSGDRKDVLDYVSGVTALVPDVSHEALGGGIIWPPANPQQTPPIAPARVTRGFVVAVASAAPLAVATAAKRYVVPQGHSLPLDLSVLRRVGFDADVAVTATDLPPNVTNASVTIPKASATGNLRLFVAKNVAPGTYTFLLRGAGPYPFSKDPNAKTKPNINLSEPSNAVSLVVRPAPLSLALNNKGGNLKAGATLEVDVTLTRQNGFADGLTIALDAPPPLKLSAPVVAIAPGQTTAKLVVTAAADSPAGAVAGVFVRATAQVRSEPIAMDEPLPLTIAK